MIEVVDQVARSADIPAQRADCLGQRAHLHIHASMAAEVIDAAAAVAAQNAGGMRIVDHHDGAILLGQIGEFVNRADVAVHRENAIGDEQLAAWLIPNFAQQLFGVATSLWRKTLIFARDNRAPSMMLA